MLSRARHAKPAPPDESPPPAPRWTLSAEVVALDGICTALARLAPDERRRVLAYVNDRFQEKLTAPPTTEEEPA